MLSSFQRELESGQQWFTRLRIQLHEEYVPLFCMFLLIIILNLIFFMWVIIVLNINFKLTIFLTIAFYSWVWFDSHILNKGGTRNYLYDYTFVLGFIRDYFPLHLVKTAELPAGRPYILALFPHGVANFGGFINFSTNVNKVRELFPGHDFRLALLSTYFITPGIREFLTTAGCCPIDKENIEYLLQSNPPKTIVLTPGGIKEMSMSHRGSEYRIVKKNRKGFVKVALETGSSLVPIFTFGEQNSYDQLNITPPPFTFLGDIIYRLLRFKLLIPNGRGLFQNKFGLMPRRHPLTTVVGKPIDVPKVENPLAELVDEYHEKFYKALSDLFEEYKGKYDEAGDAAQLIMK